MKMEQNMDGTIAFPANEDIHRSQYSTVQSIINHSEETMTICMK